MNRPTTARETIEARIAEIYEVLQTTDARHHRDLDRIMSWFAADVVYEVPFFDPPIKREGKDAVRAFMEQLQGLFCDICYRVHRVHVDEQAGTAVVEASSERTHVASGVHAVLHYVFVYRFVDGMITEMREYVNPLDLTNVPKVELD